MNGFLLVGLGGAIGASLRHGVGLAAVRLMPGWPLGTFAVNVVGSLLMGLLVGWLALRADGTGQNLRLFLATGVLGGFTTFSAFSLEIANMMRSDAIAKASMYAGLSVVLGVAALFLGLWLARRLMA
ncbi:MAG: fluoride efflux transporter CrcB [Pseudomonadota bacterium]